MKNDLRPALLCLSTLMLMLGIALTLVALLAIWLRAPETLYVRQIDYERTIVFGGESFGVVIHRVLRELGMAVAMALTGAIGVISIRRPIRPGYQQLT